jgi:hypothetical protein
MWDVDFHSLPAHLCLLHGGGQLLLLLGGGGGWHWAKTRGKMAEMTCNVSLCV